MVTPPSGWAMTADTWLLVTPLWPLACTFLILLFGWPGKRRKRQPSRWPGWVAVGSVAVSLAISSACVILRSRHSLSALGRPLHVTFGEWIPGFGVTLGLSLDGLSSVLLLLVEGIGLMVLLYSIDYMRREADQSRYYGAMLFFLAMMKLLILADNYLLLFAGWEGVGLASYLLIGYHFERWKAAQAATKAFVANRIGDAGMLVGIFALYQSCGSLSFDAIAANASAIPHGTALVISTALLIGALGKSAQIPLHVWLPDAMEGPTPVSALIHSATMVCAGVYLVARSGVLFSLTPEVSAGVAILGAATALFAASVALVEDDIKRVLAYSTISQIGFMFLALGAGAYWVAVFHLFTHAFFKALLFLGAGSVIYALRGDQNLKHMGGLRTKMPTTFVSMAVAAGALAGLPGLAGFFSKDAVLASALYAADGTPLFLIGLATSILTACYSGRLLFLVFFGPSHSRGTVPADSTEPRASASGPRESPPLMLAPMLVLSLGCLLAGWLFAPVDWHAWPLMLVSGVTAISGVWLAYHYYVSKPEARASLDRRFAVLTAALRNRWYVDAVYEEQIIDGLVLRAAQGAALFDSKLIDGTVNGAAFLTRRVSRFSRWVDRYVIDGLVRFTSGSIRAFSTPARAMQSGFVQTYAFLFVVGLLAALGYFLVRAR
jgi:NADH-quinone oxidoreductase subunit L